MTTINKLKYQNELNVILKVAEQCNIRCKYCYYYFGGDESYQKRPTYISRATIDNIGSFLEKAINDYCLTTITIVFHGGEPLLLAKKDFIYTCERFFSIKKQKKIFIDIKIQTNATLIDSDWLQILDDYSIAIGVSIDGPKEYHDVDRLDKKGRGTYVKVKEGIEKICHYSQKLRDNLSLITVINPGCDIIKIYEHFVKDLKVKNLSFILPDYNYANRPPMDPNTYVSILNQLFIYWINQDDRSIFIMYFDLLLRAFFGQTSYIYGLGLNKSDLLDVITIYSDGSLGPVDDLSVIIANHFDKTAYNVSKNTLREFYRSKIMQSIRNAMTQLPHACQSCKWKKICHGGCINHRYDQENKFDNPSLYCHGLKEFYKNVSETLINKGVKQSEINTVYE